MSALDTHPQNGLLAQPQPLQRPRIVSHHSSSLPSTPRPHARELNFSRTPSPGRGAGAHSPRSVFSESNRAMATLRPTNPSCRYQSTQTSKRRIQYTIGSDPLEKQESGVPEKLDPSVERNLSKSVERLYEELLPAEDNKERRGKVVEKLRHIFSKEWPDEDIQVSVFGSSGNTLCTGKSDVDICITMRHLENVCALAAVLAKYGLKNVVCVHAKAVPIVKIWDPENEMACDLNVNNHVALKNTQMVKAYMEMDDRSLAASGGCLSSYTWTLLVIHFLQTRKPPVLPVIPPKDKFIQPRDDFSEELEKFKDFSKKNEETVGELLFGFFRRYAHELDYDNAALAVRLGRSITKREKGWNLASNNMLCVEEPFNTDRNLGNTADDTAFRGIHLELRQAFSRIAEGKELDSEVCEQYEFPTEEPRSLFERPQPQPRPVLSRSASQSGRGGRHSLGRGGHKQKVDNRNGMNNRRSSSAAAFGHPPPHTFLQSPQLILPGQEGFPVQPHPGIGDELVRLQNQLHQQEASLRMRQHQVVLSQAQQHQQQQHAFATSQGGPRHPDPSFLSHYRHMQNGYSSPRQMSMPNPPGSAPLGYSYGSTVESPVSMSHSSSQQGASSTGPSSPMLSATTPLRRTMQRTNVVGSPNSSVRSQSQPARPYMPGYPPMPIQRVVQYNANGMPIPPELSHQNINGSTAPQHVYYGPYAGPHGPYYVFQQIPDTAVPREYLGYGIGESPLLVPPAHTPNMPQVPHFDDLRRQGRASSPRRRDDSLSSAGLGPGRSPSPLPTHHEDVNGTYNDKSSKRLTGRRRHAQEKATSPDSGPLIVNGSCSSTVSVADNDEGNSVKLRKSESISSDFPGSIHGSQSSLAESFDTAQQQQPALSNDSVKNEPGWVDVAALQRNQLPPAWISPPPAPKHLTPSLDTSIPSGARDRSPGSRISSQSRRVSNSNRPPVVPLDLATPQSTQDNSQQTNGPLLSPVQETRTPSPTSSRKPHARVDSRTNGTIPPPVPASLSNEEKSSKVQNGHARAHSTGAAIGPAVPSVAPSSQSQSNPWQQAGKKGAKNRTRAENGEHQRTGLGEPLPVDESMRKGG